MTIKSPSEHTFDSLRYDAEIQFVHERGQDEEKEYLIIAALLDTDATEWKASADFFDSFKFEDWEEFIDDEQTDELKINIGKFLEKYDDKSFY